MKRVVWLGGVFVFLFFFLMGGVSPAKVIVVENGADNVPMFIEKSDVTLAKVPDIGGKECVGFNSGTYYMTAGNSITGLKIHRHEIEPEGLIVTHEGPAVGEYLCYIIEGEGELGLVDFSGSTVATHHWQPGDLIIFRPSSHKPNALHYWTNGAEKTVFLGIEQ